MYYIKENNNIVLFNIDRKTLVNTINNFYPQYIGLEIQETERNIILYKGEYVFKDEVENQLILDRKEKFNKEFFNTSLGWIRRSVKMADGSTKDFISDLLPVISLAISAGNPVTILAYDKPDFTTDDIIWEQYQHQELVTSAFIQECFIQLSNDFLPQS